MMINRRDSIRTLFMGLCFLVCVAAIPPTLSSAEECFINQECMAVIQPNLVERACFLYAHEKHVPPESEMVMVKAAVEQHPDQLHAEFLKLVVEKRIIVLKVETPIFSCGYGLERIISDPDATLERDQLPQSNCKGVVSRFVKVRPVNTGTCYWVALENVECR